MFFILQFEYCFPSMVGLSWETHFAGGWTGRKIWEWKKLVTLQDHTCERAQKEVWHGEESKKNTWKRTELDSDYSDNIPLWETSRWTCLFVSGDLEIKLQPHFASSIWAAEQLSIVNPNPAKQSVCPGCLETQTLVILMELLA